MARRAAVIVADISGKILNWSKSAEEMLGYTFAEAVGLNVFALVPLSLRRGCEKALKAYRETGKALVLYKWIPTQAVHKDGSYIDVWLVIHPLEAGRVGFARFAGYLEKRLLTDASRE